jgi:hypothetical protein
LGEVEAGTMHQDETYPLGDVRRYDWLGNDGLFDTTSMADMLRLFEKLGGSYKRDENGEVVFDDNDTPILVEQGIYSKLENYVVDKIVLLDAYANTAIASPFSTADNIVVDNTRSFATQLALHCAVVTAKNWETIATIGMAPAPEADLMGLQFYINCSTGALKINHTSDELDPTSDEYKFKKYLRQGINLDFANDHFMYNEATMELIHDDEGDPIDIGRYLSVVFGPEVGLVNGKLGYYAPNGAAVYGAFVTTLPGEESTTNHQVKTINGLRYTLSEAQHNQLVGGRYITFQEKYVSSANGMVKKYVVKDGVTAAQPNSDYTRLSALRIVHECVQLVRQKADPFLGLPNGMAQRNALYAEIQSGLDKYKEMHKLQNFSFTIYASARDRVIGNSFITLELVPEFENRKFFTSVSLRPSL